MRKLKLKLKFDEMQVLDFITSIAVADIHAQTYADKAAVALIVDFNLKKIKPHTYIKYDKSTGLSLSMAEAFALVFIYQNIIITDAYQLNVMRTIITGIEPKIIR